MASTVQLRQQRLMAQLEKALVLEEQVIKQARHLNTGQLILPDHEELSGNCLFSRI